MPAPPIARGFLDRLPRPEKGKSYGFESWDFATDGPLPPETLIIFSVCEGMLGRRARASSVRGIRFLPKGVTSPEMA